MVIIYTVDTICTVCTVYIVCTVCTVHTVCTVCTVYTVRIAKYAVCGKLIAKYAVYCSLLRICCETCGLP
jgi:hypothetical protein